MNTKIRSILTAASLLALSAVTSHAQLLITGITHTYTNVIGPATLVNNGVANTVSEVWSPSSINQIFGVTATPSITIAPATPVLATFPINLTLGSSTQLDSWVLNQQGPAAVGSLFSSYDVAIGFDFAGGILNELVSTYHVAINQTSTTDTQYTITRTSPQNGIVVIGGTSYGYSFVANGLTGELDASAGSANALAFISLRVSAVPEPSTYALFGAVGLMGLVAIRRFRRSKSVTV